MKDRYVVIMAGGRGERFWPESRLRRPKQLLPIAGEEAMLTQTLNRLPGLVPLENTLVLTNREQIDSVREVCPSLPAENIIAEPEGRDTAAAVGLATLMVKRRSADASLAMLPADHVIANHERFRAVLEAAFLAAEQDPVLVTIGIVPTEPATGYGYIQKGEPMGDLNGRSLFAVRRFVEKPDLETARKYLDSGDFFWNGGMFVWQVSTIERAFEEHAPELRKAFVELEADMIEGGDFETVLSRHFPKLPRISVDFAIMEKARNVVTVSADFDWDDVGAWPAAARHMNPMGEGNVSRGRALVENGSGNIIVSDPDHLVALVGCDNLVVVHTDDATLVCPKGESQRIKDLVKRLGRNPVDRELL
ncbi:MAG: mannose-1-phosphate guanyltransferase [Verrucomicrobia bacterium]|nr:MAG: mannose-1-phosphate guanyltransferase [Verrucomicrobiota bacterium]